MTRDRAATVLALTPQVELVASSPTMRVYAVPSQSEPTVRLVRVYPSGRMACDCPGGVHYRACVHCGAVVLARAWWARAAQRVPVRGACRRGVVTKAA